MGGERPEKKSLKKLKEHMAKCSLAESPECSNLEFQPVEIFADNFLIFADKFNIFASNLSSMLIKQSFGAARSPAAPAPAPL